MLWFGKKKKQEIPEEEKDNAVKDEFDSDNGELDTSENDFISEMPENETGVAAVESDDIDDGEEVDKEQSDVTVIVHSLDELVDFVNSKPIGGIQLMRKENNEAFTLREAHLRIARVWGSVSMAREYTAQEYAKIMLAIEVIEEPDSFYVLPMLSDQEREKAIADFSNEKYGNGKKYARNTAKFARIVNENGDKEEWISFTKQIVAEKISEFCEANGIVFVPSDTEKAEGNTDE